MEIKSFCVPFTAGTHGTWLSWFIDQHQNFPNMHYLDSFTLTINGKEEITDYASLPSWWHKASDRMLTTLPYKENYFNENPTPELESHSQFLRRNSLYIKNKQFTKCSVKFFPDHLLEHFEIDELKNILSDCNC